MRIGIPAAVKGRYLAKMQRHFRARRMRQFASEFKIGPQTRILDLGGTLDNWLLIDERPHLTLLNLPGRFEQQESPNVEWVQGDARDIPFSDGSFDIVFSNSVIEHLGDKTSQEQFATEVRRVGLSYYVQTPNRRFPFELHFLTPLFHFLPVAVQRRLARNFTVWGLITRPTQRQVDELVTELRLLDANEMATLFPDATLKTEKLTVLVKSLIAVRRA